MDVSGIDTRNVTYMSGMFSGCENLTSVDVSGFDTRNVTHMSSMFSSCKNLTNVDVSGFDTRNVRDMGSMFSSCKNLTNVDVSGFNTENVLYMNGMFADCSNLTSVDVSGFNTENVWHMKGMFAGCKNLTSLDLSSFDLSGLLCRTPEDPPLGDFLPSLESALTSIYTPRNCSIDGIALPKNSNELWHDVNGKEYNNLPVNREDSILLLRGDSTNQPVEKITVRKAQTIYHCGDIINTDDIVVRHYAKDGTVKKVSDFTTNASEIDMTTLGEKTLTITYIPENGNGTEPLTANVKLTVTYANVKISGIKIKNSVYSKTPVSYTGTAKVTSETDDKDLTNVVTLTYTYSGTQADGSAYADTQTAPVNAGNYTLTVAVVVQEGQTYAGSVEYPFKIIKAPLTVTARDMGLKIGADLPKGQDYQYDLTGLMEGDKLLKEPVLACSITDTAGAGTYDITISGADAGMNYEITYKNGTLTVNETGEIAAYYTVVFNMNGHGTDITNTGIKEGSLLEKPQNPQAQGYIFTGWYKDKDCTALWDFGKDTVTSDTTLYAGWKADGTGGGNDNGNDDDKEDSPYEDGERIDFESGNVDAKIAEIKAKVYDGSTYKPVVKVTVAEGKKRITLTEGADYRVLYQDNVNAGRGRVIVKGNGIYKGKIEKFLTINPKPIKKLKILTGSIAGTPTKQAASGAIYVYDGAKRLVEGTDYELTEPQPVKNKKDVVQVAVKGINNYSGESAPKKINVYAEDTQLITPECVQLDKTSVPYTGKVIKDIKVTVTFKGSALKPKTDYSVQYQNNKNAGTAYILVKGKKAYKGTVVVPFTIHAETVAEDDVIIKEIKPKTFNGKLQKPSVSVSIKKNGKTKKLSAKDYTITYKNNFHAGTATVLVTGKGNYEGLSGKQTFEIKPQQMKKASLKGIQGDFTLTYNKRKLKEGTDYEPPTYGTPNKNKVEVTIQGKGDFTGSLKKKVKVSGK